MDDELTIAIRKLTLRTIAYRFYLENERHHMALEIKGLKGKALKARANLDALNAAYDKFNEAAPAHMADVESLTSQVAGMQDDLEFATNVLGNSVERLADEPPKTLNGGSAASTEPSQTSGA